jgi:hypothetical protein
MKKETTAGPHQLLLRPVLLSFALYMGRGYNPQQFITLFAGRSNADRQMTQLFAYEFGESLPLGGWCQCYRSFI